MYFLKTPSGLITNKIKRELEDKLQAITNERQNAIINVITDNVTNITKSITDLNFIFRQLDVVSSKLDGELGSNNEPVLYDLSGDTFFGAATNEGTIGNLYTKKIPEVIKKFEDLLVQNKIVTDIYQKNT